MVFQFGVLVAAYRRYFGIDWYKNSTHINELGYMLCGFASIDLLKIAPSTFKELNINVLGRLDKCDVNQTKVTMKRLGRYLLNLATLCSLFRMIAVVAKF